jgi:hypothetical protein
MYIVIVLIMEEGCICGSSPNTTISGSVYGNSANYDGGGLYLYNSPNTTISGNVYGNSANYDGGGVYLLSFNK